MYYLRTKAGAEAIKFTVPTQAEQQLKPIVNNNDALAAVTCSIDNRDDCEACSG
jgi:ribonucleoside-diphosphate reductase alpha chain